ncbi:MAG TPA: hypothetical protein VGL39_16540 [Jatrophihabitantaceae bacterium]
MIPDPVPNLTARPYRGLSVQDVAIDLTAAALTDWIIGRDVYRRTEFLLARRDGRACLVALEKAPGPDLFLPVVAARIIARADQVVLVDSPDTDVGNATALAEIAGQHRSAGALAYVVTGCYRHVNFIWQPTPVVLYVDEVVPPHPPKLVDMVRQAIRFDEELPPVRVVSRLISLPMLMRTRPQRPYLLPCRGAGTGAASAEVSYLDAGPAERDDWTVIGCERSKQIYQHHYGGVPSNVDFCPDAVGARAGSGVRLTKCCLLERGTRVAHSVAVVPWGANLDEVRSAVTALVGP